MFEYAQKRVGSVMTSVELLPSFSKLYESAGALVYSFGDLEGIEIVVV